MVIDCTETQNVKRTRAPASPFNIVPETKQNLDDKGDSPEIPIGFLSPSVREYLELGKSIPGKNFIIISNWKLNDHELTLPLKKK